MLPRSPIPHGIVRDGSGFSDHIPLLTLRAYKRIIRRRGLDRQEALNPFAFPNERAYFRAYFRAENRTLFRTGVGVIRLVL